MRSTESTSSPNVLVPLFFAFTTTCDRSSMAQTPEHFANDITIAPMAASWRAAHQAAKEVRSGDIISAKNTQKAHVAERGVAEAGWCWRTLEAYDSTLQRGLRTTQHNHTTSPPLLRYTGSIASAKRTRPSTVLMDLTDGTASGFASACVARGARAPLAVAVGGTSIAA